MKITAPEWLQRRGGVLRLCPDRLSSAVLIENRPEYRLTPVPAEGKYACDVMQTNNGRRIESEEIYSTPDDAVRGGLEVLRTYLGW